MLSLRTVTNSSSLWPWLFAEAMEERRHRRCCTGSWWAALWTIAAGDETTIDDEAVDCTTPKWHLVAKCRHNVVNILVRPEIIKGQRSKKLAIHRAESLEWWLQTQAAAPRMAAMMISLIDCFRCRCEGRRRWTLDFFFCGKGKLHNHWKPDRLMH